MEFEHWGNALIWDLSKTAFLCSRKVPAAVVLKCYDWAVAMREAGTCVMLGAHSPLEKDVLHYLLKGTQPVVLVLARGMKK
ncbi:MAG: DNA-binding protein, partial [Bacteroidetes bacterium]|nr:DNA-binding protein [Bacteroidota bacterium]